MHGGFDRSRTRLGSGGACARGTLAVMLAMLTVLTGCASQARRSKQMLPFMAAADAPPAPSAPAAPPRPDARLARAALPTPDGNDRLRMADSAITDRTDRALSQVFRERDDVRESLADSFKEPTTDPSSPPRRRFWLQPAGGLNPSQLFHQTDDSRRHQPFRLGVDFVVPF